MPAPPNPSDPPQPQPEGLPEEGRTRTIPSETLLNGQTEVLITHGAEIYRLRLTRNGKLILQK